MANFTMLVVLIGLFCFPVSVIAREFRSGNAVVYVLLTATIISLVWFYLDTLPSSDTRYGAFCYAAVLALSAYLYFNDHPRGYRSSFVNAEVDKSIIRQNAGYLIIASTVVVVGLIYAFSHRYEGILDKPRDRLLILDTWTGEVKTKY